MPKNCMECPCLNHENGECQITGNRDTYTMERPRNCPLSEQEPKADVALERYKDLQDYFDDEEIAKSVLENQKEFKVWLERIKWHVRKADELARKLEPELCDDVISRQAVLNALYALCDTGETLNENPWRDNPHIDAVTETVESIKPQRALDKA